MSLRTLAGLAAAATQTIPAAAVTVTPAGLSVVVSNEFTARRWLQWARVTGAHVEVFTIRPVEAVSPC